MEKRIVIAGPSGAGKTTISKWISQHYNIPYLHTNGPTLRAFYGCKSHRDLVVMSANIPDKGMLYQIQLLHERIELCKNKEYVMDRSLIDNLAYVLLQNSAHVSEKDMLEFINYTTGSFLNNKPTHIIAIPPFAGTPEDDSVRIQNFYYQVLTWETMKWAADKYLGISLSNASSRNSFNGVEVLVLNMWDLDWRKEQVMKFLH